MSYLIFAMLLGVPTAPDMVASNFNFGFHYGQSTTRSATPPEEGAYYLTTPTGDYLTTPTGDRITRVHP